jgi:hypothetical protein
LQWDFETFENPKVLKSHAYFFTFLHGDIGETGDIVNIATSAMQKFFSSFRSRVFSPASSRFSGISRIA